ncbi:MAG: TetR/AcrR family transcriptional regulator [Halobacterium sp.]
MSSGGPDRTDAEAELLAATGAVLAEHGVAGTTTQKIADEWGRSQSLVHYYYDTKEDLVVAWIDALRESQRERYAERADDPPLDRIEWAATADLATGDGAHPDEDAARSVSALYDLHGEAPHNDRYRDALDAFEADGREFLADAVRDGVDAGTFRDVDPDAVSLFLLSASDGALLRTVSLGRTGDAPGFRAAAEQYVREVLLTEDARESWGGFAEVA